MKIIVCGLNGAGKSTLGRALAQRLGFPFLDIEDYYFPEVGDYKYRDSRTREEVAALLLRDLRELEHAVLASVKGDYGSEVEAQFTHAVYLDVPREIRLARVRERAYGQFGERIRPGGDLYDREERFFVLVRERTDAHVLDWLDRLRIPVVRMDGTQSVASGVERILGALQAAPHTAGS